MSALDDLRSSQDRDLRRVGIPMLVVLRDERTAAAPDVADEGSATREGERLAERLDELRAELAPGQRDSDMGLVSTLLTVAAHLDFGQGRQQESL